MANIKQTPSTQARLGKTGHDLSHRFIFSSTVGQLLPIYVDELIPGDHVKISADMFTRTVPLETPPFTRVTEHIDYFFVPMQQLYTFFGDFITGVNDIQTTLVTVGGDAGVNATPYIETYSMLSWLYSYRSDVDQFGASKAVNAYRLLDYLGYGYNFKEVFEYKSEEDIPKRYQHLNLWRLAAYQKIFYDFYRLTDWTSNNRFAYNLDRYYYDGSYTREEIGPLLELHYRPWKKDFYTNVLPTPMMAGNSINAFQGSYNLDDVRQWLTGSHYLPVDSTNTQVTDSSSQNVPPTTVAINSSVNSGSPFDNVASISTAFAIRKLLEITRRAAKHYDAQVLAHFGVKVPRGLAGEVYHLGSQSSVLQIGDVVSTAQAGDEPLGSLAGKGFGSLNGNGCDFTADCHGIIMAIYSAVPESDYIHKGIDRQITYMTRFDWYQPEFDNLGMQPVFSSDLDWNFGDFISSPLAWQYNHFENKQKLDQVHGCFANSRYSDWVTVRNYQLSWNYYRDLYIDPSYLDSITGVNFLAPDFQDGTFATDPLLHDLYFKSYKTSVMSTYGLESL